MREIKFRVWDKANQKFEYFDLGSANLYENVFNRYESEVQQFTGLSDKNKKEIYEGDIVKFKWVNPAEEVEETQGEVFWDDQMVMFSFDRSFNFAMNDSCFLQETLEVVGNIFEK